MKKYKVLLRTRSGDEFKVLETDDAGRAWEERTRLMDTKGGNFIHLDPNLIISSAVRGDSIESVKIIDTELLASKIVSLNRKED